MPFVLDASVAHAWLLGEGSVAADAVKLKMESETAVAPTLWWFEIRNGLVMAERRRRLSEAEANAALRVLAGLAIAFDYTPDEAAVLAFARQHRLTVYDAAYLELAMRRKLPLATLDAALAHAARAEGAELVGDRP